MLFAKEELPRSAPVKRMRVADAGHLAGGTAGIRFECRRCGHDTGWMADECTVTENKLGLPCPCCNPQYRDRPEVSR